MKAFWSFAFIVLLITCSGVPLRNDFEDLYLSKNPEVEEAMSDVIEKINSYVEGLDQNMQK